MPGLGCLTNFDHEGQKLTIWKQHSEHYELMEFGVLGKTLPLTYDPLFQSIAADMWRLAEETGRARRAEIESERRVAALERIIDEIAIPTIVEAQGRHPTEAFYGAQLRAIESRRHGVTTPEEPR